MDVWNYRGDGSWSFVALKRPGDARLFCARNNTTAKISYCRRVFRKKDAAWVEANTPSDDFIVNPKDKVKLIPVIDVPMVMNRDADVRSIFNPWYTLYFPDPGQITDADLAALITQVCNVVTEGALLFRKVSKALTISESETRVLGIAVASINDATCISSILDVDYYDTSRDADAA